MLTRYPGFDVTEHAGAWDPHTRAVVLKRFEPPQAPSHLSKEEAAALESALSCLLGEERGELLAFVVAHFDQKLGSKVGEGQRKAGVPPFPDLLRHGLAALDALAGARCGGRFADCTAEEQRAILSDLQFDSAGEVPEAATLPQKEFFQQLLGTAVEAYASHPAVWSEIGYAGPAYPRGYYRIERGLADPWEPRAERGCQDAGDDEVHERSL